MNKVRVYARPSEYVGMGIYAEHEEDSYSFGNDDRYFYLGEIQIDYSMAELKAHFKPAIVKELEIKRDDLRAAALKIQEQIDSMLAIEHIKG